jgi:uncharacterized membrane protein
MPREGRPCGSLGQRQYVRKGKGEPMANAHENLDERLLHRLLFFTDAVFAIVLTILVLELRAPETFHVATFETFREALPHVAAFIFSFVIIGVFWLAHMNTTRRLATFDWLTAVANLAFLLPLSMLPYATAWFGADPVGETAWSIYCWTLVAISLGNVFVVMAAHRGSGRLIAGGSDPREAAYRIFRAAIPGLSFAVGLIVMATGRPILAHWCALLIGPLFLLARFLKPKMV